MQQKAVKFSLPSKKKQTTSPVTLGSVILFRGLWKNCPQIVFSRLKTEAGVGEDGRQHTECRLA